MRHNLFFVTVFVAISSVFLVGCNKSVTVDNPTEISTAIQGTESFIASLKLIDLPKTKGGELSNEDILALEQSITPIFPLAISYLQENGYDYREDFEDNDPLIILTAYGLAESDYMYRVETKSFWDDAAAVGACVVFGADIYALGKIGAKQIAKALLKKAVPYVGAVLGVAEATACIIGYYD